MHKNHTRKYRNTLILGLLTIILAQFLYLHVTINPLSLISNKSSPQEWHTLSLEAKIEKLEEIKDIIIDDLNIMTPVLTEYVEIDEPDDRQIYGAMQHGFMIWINTNHLNETLCSAIDTLAHEIRHIYQIQQAKLFQNKEYEMLSASKVYEDDFNPKNYAMRCSTNFKFYKYAETDGYDAYFNQFIEKDARAYASTYSKHYIIKNYSPALDKVNPSVPVIKTILHQFYALYWNLYDYVPTEQAKQSFAVFNL